MGCAAASRGGRVEHKKATLGGDPSQDPRWRNSAAAPTSDGEAARVATRPGPQRKLPQKGYPPSSLIHVTVRHRWGVLLLLRQVGDQRLGGQQERGDRRRVLQRHPAASPPPPPRGSR